jgi:stage V sporulation protein D (sporulation-specific penicillin-binding protein)
MKSSFSSGRTIVVSVFFIIFAILIYGKLFILQVVNHEKFSLRADKSYVIPSAGTYDRGTIFLSKKDGSLVSGATIATGYTLVLIPKNISNPEQVFEKLSAVIPDLNKDEFFRKASKKDDPHEELLVRLGEDIAKQIKDLNLKEISLEREHWRYYPGETLASRAIGFVAYKGDDLIGRYGLEREYNNTLKRRSDSLYVNFFAEVFGDLHKTIFQDEDLEGDIVTTIEPTTQKELEKILRSIRLDWSSDQVGGIVMDPKTGEILAMAVVPDFDLNEFSKVTDQSLYANPLVEGVYELGSIIKVLTMASGIDVGVVTPSTTYKDEGFIVLNKKTIKNFDGKGRGVVDMQEVLSQSLNTGATFVMQKLGRERFRDYFYSFGLNEKTNIDLPGEVSNIVGNLKSTRDVEYATASFGQGVALTPISAIRAFSAVANEGYLVDPHIVKEIKYNTTSKKVELKKGRQVLKPETTLTIASMMTNILDKSLMGGSLKLENYSVAIKTGTAQIARTDGKGYYDDQYLHSMVGFYPTYDPKFLVLIYNVNPKNVTYAANTLAKPFMNLAKVLLSYYNVPPDR